VTALATLRDKPWLWAFVAALAVWLATIGFTGGHGGGGVLTAAFTFATFFVIVGIGQMFVITLGPGNVDLSIPATITLAGSVATKVMDSQNSMIAVGLLAALACGVAVGCANYALIRILRIPPIIATLSSSFIVQSTAIAYGRGLRVKPPPWLADFTTARIFEIPVLALVVIALAAVMSVISTARPTGARCSPSARTHAPLALPAWMSAASASPPMCSPPCWRACAATCSPASRAAHR
jgi:ribose transport system permease protein